MSDLSPGVRALLNAAKSDAPSGAARASMWGAVSTATGAGAVGAGSSIAVATAASSGKLLVVGALLGSALTLGVALAVVRVAPGVAVPRRALPRETAEMARSSGEPSYDEVQAIPLAIDTPRSSIAAPVGLAGPLRVARGTSAVARTTKGAGSVHVGLEDPLMREAALVAEARGALLRSDPESALSSLDAARRVGSRDLEPEELSLRARSLRVLGRDAEAAVIEGKLKSRYPDHFLSR
jgi:hypothetical protein